MTRFAICLSVAVLYSGLAFGKGPVYTDPSQTDADFAFQGEYAGQIPSSDGPAIKVGAQVVAQGQGKFRVIGYVGGLPGDGWNGQDKHEAKGELRDGVLHIEGEHAKATVKDGVMTILGDNSTPVGKMEKVERKSRTLGKKPLEEAIVLFDGTNTDAWENGKKTDDGLLMPGTRSKPHFGSHKLHIEFRLPYQPEDSGQARGNSGIYLQGRYEVQMLDSFGLDGKDNECGGLYSVKAPDVNMCYPPLTWQTYDIEYTAAKFDDSGKLIANPRITVLHNGVEIHHNVELPGNRSTTAAPVPPGPDRGPVYLQDHGNPVRYRNVWVVESD